MRAFLLVPLIGLALPAVAAEKQAPRVETGFEVGALGLAAIDRRDWSAAEQQLLATRGVSTNDPARLINLGRVYAETGRHNLAIASFRKAMESPHPYAVTLGDGTVATTDQVARAALARYDLASAN